MMDESPRREVPVKRTLTLVGIILLISAASVTVSLALGDQAWSRDCLGILEILPIEGGSRVTCYEEAPPPEPTQPPDTPPPAPTDPPPTAPPPPPTAVPGAIELPGRFEVEDYKEGGEGVGYHDTTSGNRGGAYRSDDVDIEACSDGANCYNVGWIVGGEWLAYNVRFANDGTYIFKVRAATPDSGRFFHIELNGVDVTGPIAVPQTGAWHSWGEAVSAAVSVPAGEYELRIVADTRRFNMNYVVVEAGSGAPPPPPPPPPAPTPTPSGDVRGQLCPESVHAGHVTTGPDGNTYPTWHPQVDPGSGCYFDHEHGDDPRTSRADSSMPAFGYIGAQVGLSEPHGGFKVFVANRGDRNDEGRTAQADSRIVFHMGTGGVGRFSGQFHSLEYDVVFPDGKEAHVMGMADTGVVGSICNRNASAPNRTVQFIPGAGCDTDSLYEIWAIRFTVGDRLELLVSTAVFDPITVMNPLDLTELIYAADVPAFSSFGGEFHGCDREAYHGPIYWRNAGGSTTYRTDAYGQISANGVFEQVVSVHNVIGPAMTNDGLTQFKMRESFCAAGLGLGN